MDIRLGKLVDLALGIVELSLGVRSPQGEAWYSAFPVSGVEDDGNSGFSAQLDNIPDAAEVCVYMRGDSAVRTEWTPVSSAVNA